MAKERLPSNLFLEILSLFWACILLCFASVCSTALVAGLTGRPADSGRPTNLDLCEQSICANTSNVLGDYDTESH